ncbi:MAG TPA: ABC transporter ATP-binding protein [Candidatus Stercoripulliclostridium merdigallinarum]|uniref:ABC transporter ATP-binding protein n=1 Tax=Candidatus Stercoripulliclostridium merdigallinarum TaxID=2840951 RepID=A0A9D1MII8_9FIRM|nr:ABC transporter ATP-binding protein [Candidatus Stercoripulliclostridium merdigallinarum]
MHLLKTIGKSVREYKKPSILAPIFIVVEVVMETVIPLIMAMLIDEFGNGIDPILKYGGILLGMAVISLVSGMLAARFSATAATGLAANLRKDMYYSVQDFSFKEIDKFSVSSLVTRMTTDVMNVQNAYQMIIRGAIRTPLMLIVSFAMAFTVNSTVALAYLVAVPILGVALFLIAFKVMPYFRRSFRRYDAMNSAIQENVRAIRVVKSFVTEEYEKKKFAAHVEDVRRDFTTAEKILALNNPIMMFSIYAIIMVISAIGANLIIKSGGTSMTTGDLTALIGYAGQILGSMMMLSMIMVMITMSVESAKRITEVLETKPSIVSPENGVKEVPNGDIVFKDVSFRYSEKAERNALEDINLTIKSGETIGIIGGTGSSKSTLVQLIPRLYDVTEGTLTVGGIDVKDYDLIALRDAVSVVLQKNVLFEGTIAENIRWGNKDAGDEEVARVCALAQAAEFINEFPDKYNTHIEQGGANVSGGQKQRLCIARALLKKPKILILDDSTSAVDTKTDALIRKAFREEIPDTTKIIIAQRIVSVEDADKILVMDGGKIVNMGTHEELLKTSSIYREVYESQTKGKEAEDDE